MSASVPINNNLVHGGPDDMGDIPKYLEDSPISANWVDYNGKRKFAMINFDESIKRGKLMIDLCYCATAGMINHRVEKTVPYSKKRFVVLENTRFY